MAKGIVIGAGPSLFKYKHLELLAGSDFKGHLLITDRILKPCLEAGITPDKFPNYYVFTVEDAWQIENYLSGVKECDKITLIHSSRTKKVLLEKLQAQGYRILCDYWPYLSALNNVGLMAFHYGWRKLELDELILIGMDQGDYKPPIFPENTDCYREFYKKIHNYSWDCDVLLNPLHQLWYESFMDLLQLVPENVKIINATEGGSIDHKRIIPRYLYNVLYGKPRSIANVTSKVQPRGNYTL